MAVVSSLSVYNRWSPNWSPRYERITKITPHHMAGNLSIESCGNIFANPSRQASANYGIGSDGRIGCYVSEDKRAWTSGSEWNDQRAVTIEVANISGGPDWMVSDLALESLINLCVDICKRYGNKSVTYDETPNGSLTMHRMYQPTTCPGPYLASKFSYIASEINKRIGSSYTPPNLTKVPSKTTMSQVVHAVLRGDYGNFPERKTNLEKAGFNYGQVQAAVDAFLKGGYSSQVVTSAPAPEARSSALQVAYDIIDKPNFAGYGTGADRVSRLSAKGYDPSEVQGYIDRILAGETFNSAPAPTVVPITGSIGVGSKVRITRAVAYNGQSIADLHGVYDVIEIIGVRAVIAYNGAVYAAIHVGNLTLA